MVGPNAIEPVPTLYEAGYLTGCAESIAHGLIPESQLEPYISTLSPMLESPHAQQTLLSALFCRWAFLSPEPMLTWEEIPEDLYTTLAALAAFEGLAKVSRYFKRATQHLFMDPEFKRTELTPRISELAARLTTYQQNHCKPPDIPLPRTPEAYAAYVIEWKQTLLLSPKEYKIHFACPGATFDARWMIAMDAENFELPIEKVEGKKVACCLFPALVSGDKEEKEGEKMEDVLVRNKKFFPSYGEMNQRDEGWEEGRVSKATVLVL